MFKNKKRVGQYHPPKNQQTGSHASPVWQEIKVKLPIGTKSKALLECSKIELWAKQRTHLEADNLFQTNKLQREQLQSSVAWVVECAKTCPSIRPALLGFLDEQLQPRQFLRAQLEALLNQIPPGIAWE